MNPNLLFLFKDAGLTLWSLRLRAKWELDVIKTIIMLSLIRFEDLSGKSVWSLRMVFFWSSRLRSSIEWAEAFSYRSRSQLKATMSHGGGTGYWDIGYGASCLPGMSAFQISQRWVGTDMPHYFAWCHHLKLLLFHLLFFSLFPLSVYFVFHFFFLKWG